MKNEIKEILEICDEFLSVPSTTGFEFPFLNYLNKKIKKIGYKTILKNKYLVVTNSKAKNLFSSHIDRQGLTLNEGNKFEYSAFYEKKKLGSKFARELNDESEKELLKEFEKDKLTIHGDLLRIKNNSGKYFNFQRSGNAIFFEKVALRYIRENISSYDKKTGKILNKFKTTRYDLDLDKNEITFELNKETSKEDKVFMINSQISSDEFKFSAQIDNVISASVLFYLLKNTDFKDEIIFTTGEEYGNSWIDVVDYVNENGKFDLKLLVLDTSPYSNLEKYEKGFLTLRHGDENGGFDEKLVTQIKNILEKEKIPFDFKPSYLGKTELGRISTESCGKINGATIQIPTMNYHTSFETATIKSLENYLKICKIISKN